ncbi:potassium transporter TrkA [Halarcobacter mediterraneus]|uniref:Potassium transporter TrkA n=1 Tax=Halarcobacter mediterraneus TaxID=2023153 RepID=A0A4Q1B5B1_9BACT|nr:TrkA C-terminal domain-containing protein [Halarcobacter mediterraneus]RXK13487.1 potassium transporter TrkA [Halarcobacter mediterraneus]
MKKILIILDGIVAKKLMRRIVESNTTENNYDVVYMNDAILPEQKPSNFTFYKFDPTSESKLAMVLDKDIHTQALIALNSKDEMLNVIKNIKARKSTLHISMLDYWGIEIEDPYINIYKGIEVLANGMVERLPNIPVMAQNIGLKQGEIMEIKIPFGSSYAYRYIGSIEQNEWKIFALYRNEKLINIKPSLILKPNDLILVVGKPTVLMQVYNAIGKSQGQFPMPFGHHLYFYLDMYVQNKQRIEDVIKEIKYLNKMFKNTKMIIRITRPTTVGLLSLIKESFHGDDSVLIKMDYHNIGIRKLLRDDMRKHDIGMVIMTNEMFKDKTATKELKNLKIPIFKLGEELTGSIKKTIVVINDINSYEQISPVVFDVASQLKTKTKIFDMDPVGKEADKTTLLNHFENLAKIFNQKLEIISSDDNPIRELKKQKSTLQILPLKEEMFKQRFSWRFLYTNPDLIAFDLKKYSQLLIPVIEE